MEELDGSGAVLSYDPQQRDRISGRNVVFACQTVQDDRIFRKQAPQKGRCLPRAISGGCCWHGERYRHGIGQHRPLLVIRKGWITVRVLADLSSTRGV